MTGGLTARVLARRETTAWAGSWVARIGAVVVLVMGTTLVLREARIGQAERAVVLAEVVAVRSAPADDDDLTLFEVHEGTHLRIDQRAGAWAEVVLDDGKVGWIPTDAIGVI